MLSLAVGMVWVVSYGARSMHSPFPPALAVFSLYLLASLLPRLMSGGMGVGLA